MFCLQLKHASKWCKLLTLIVVTSTLYCPQTWKLPKVYSSPSLVSIAVWLLPAATLDARGTRTRTSLWCVAMSPAPSAPHWFDPNVNTSPEWIISILITSYYQNNIKKKLFYLLFDYVLVQFLQIFIKRYSNVVTIRNSNFVICHELRKQKLQHVPFLTFAIALILLMGK